MKKKDENILEKKKNEIEAILSKNNMPDQHEPVMKNTNIEYQMSDRIEAIEYGGIGVIHTFLKNLKFDKLINENLSILKTHVPYYESDHTFTLLYNILTNGEDLIDIDRLRNNKGFLKSINATRIPDPTTSGDFLRRFDNNCIIKFQSILNQIQQQIWTKKNQNFETAIIDIDATISQTTSECMEGIGLSYNGKWGYAPIVVTLANTREHLCLINRNGNTHSAKDAGEILNNSIDIVKPFAKNIILRGDTAYSLTTNFDNWTSNNINFIFGYDAKKNLIEIADTLPEEKYKNYQKNRRSNKTSKKRKKGRKYKQEFIEKKEYQNLELESEHYTEINYQPTACSQNYRIIILRKTINVKKGQTMLYPEKRYFFYITNIKNKHPKQLLKLIHKRCNHENTIEQLKNGVKAMKMPTSDFNANWVYMLIGVLAWNIKSWYGLICKESKKRDEIINMEFKKFYNSFINIPCQIISTGRKIIYKILTYTKELKFFFEQFALIKQLKFT